jgi:hypothetical protein
MVFFPLRILNQPNVVLATEKGMHNEHPIQTSNKHNERGRGVLIELHPLIKV